MKIEHVHNGLRYTLSNEGVSINEKVFPIAHGRCCGANDWVLHGFSFESHCSGFPDEPHTIIDLKYSDYKPQEVRTSHGFGPKEIYFKIIKIEKQIVVNPDSMFKRYEWQEIIYED